jgi:hypothetical protein
MKTGAMGENFQAFTAGAHVASDVHRFITFTFPILHDVDGVVGIDTVMKSWSVCGAILDIGDVRAKEEGGLTG